MTYTATQVTCLTSLGWFNRKKSWLEKRYQLLATDDYAAVLWQEIAKGQGVFTLDMFFIAFNSQNLFSERVSRELVKIIARNVKLQWAILAVLGDKKAASHAHRIHVTVVNDLRNMSLESMLALGWKRLTEKLEIDLICASGIMHCKKIARRLYALDAQLLGTACSLAIIRDPKLWKRIFPPKKWYETKKHFLARKARLNQNSVFAQYLIALSMANNLSENVIKEESFLSMPPIFAE